MIKGIDVVFIHVKDPKLAKWYMEALDLEISFQTDDLHWQEFNIPSSVNKTWFALDFPSNTDGPNQQSTMISFSVDDIKSGVQVLEKNGVSFVSDPIIMDVGFSLVTTFMDPEGNSIQLSQRK